VQRRVTLWLKRRTTNDARRKEKGKSKKAKGVGEQ